MKALITGSTGFIGSFLLKHLESRGVGITSFSTSSSANGPHIRHVVGDIRDRDSVRDAIEGVDTVFHLASVVSITKKRDRHVFDVNVNGVRNLMNQCRECQVKKIIYVSSIHAFDQRPRSQPLNESRAYVLPHPLLVYNRSKAEAEMIVKQAASEGMDAVIVNPTGVIGPYHPYASHMGYVLFKMFQGKMSVLVRGGFNWVDVRDVVSGIYSAALNGKSGENYILGGHYSSLCDLFRLAGSIAGMKARPIAIPNAMAKMIAPIAVKWNEWMNQGSYFTPQSVESLRANTRVDCSKAVAELGYNPRRLEETMRDIHRWLNRNGYLA